MPTQLENEIDRNAASFAANWMDAHAANVSALQANPVFLSSYRRLAAVQAFKTHIIVGMYSDDSAAFFHEAHNDALTSHVAASSGAWRSALQNLRSCLENTLCAFFYKDHPVELELWSQGRYVIAFADLIKYAEKHPILSALDRGVTGLQIIKDEYATLSKAVHGSATNFRMTDAASNVLLWSDDPAKASAWATREKKVIEGLLLLLVCAHHEMLRGTKLVPLRNVLGYAIGAAHREQLRAMSINIPIGGG